MVNSEHCQIGLLVVWPFTLALKRRYLRTMNAPYSLKRYLTNQAEITVRLRVRASHSEITSFWYQILLLSCLIRLTFVLNWIVYVSLVLRETILPRETMFSIKDFLPILNRLVLLNGPHFVLSHCMYFCFISEDLGQEKVWSLQHMTGPHNKHLQ